MQLERTGKKVEKSFMVTWDMYNYFPLLPKGCETTGGGGQLDRWGKTMLRRAHEYMVQTEAEHHDS